MAPINVRERDDFDQRLERHVFEHDKLVALVERCAEVDPELDLNKTTGTHSPPQKKTKSTPRIRTAPAHLRQRHKPCANTKKTDLHHLGLGIGADRGRGVGEQHLARIGAWLGGQNGGAHDALVPGGPTQAVSTQGIHHDQSQ